MDCRRSTNGMKKLASQPHAMRKSLELDDLGGQLDLAHGPLNRAHRRDDILFACEASYAESYSRLRRAPMSALALG